MLTDHYIHFFELENKEFSFIPVKTSAGDGFYNYALLIKRADHIPFAYLFTPKSDLFWVESLELLLDSAEWYYQSWGAKNEVTVPLKYVEVPKVHDIIPVPILEEFIANNSSYKFVEPAYSPGYHWEKTAILKTREIIKRAISNLNL